MEMKKLGTESDGTRSYEIRADEISYRALLRAIRSIPGSKIEDKAHDPMNDNTLISVAYNGIKINIETPFSDYIVNCRTDNETFDKFISLLSKYKVKWWEHYF